MTALRSELSSISSSLAELTRRVSALAEQANGARGAEEDTDAADLATELFTVERSLKGALRRLERSSGSGRA